MGTAEAPEFDWSQLEIGQKLSIELLNGGNFYKFSGQPTGRETYEPTKLPLKKVTFAGLVLMHFNGAASPPNALDWPKAEEGLLFTKHDVNSIHSFVVHRSTEVRAVPVAEHSQSAEA